MSWYQSPSIDDFGTHLENVFWLSADTWVSFFLFIPTSKEEPTCIPFFRLPVGGYHFLSEEDEDFQKIQSFFTTVEEIHRGREKGLTDANMPSWDTLFPHDKEGVGQGFFIEADVHVPDDRHEYLQGLPPAPAHTKIGVDDLPPHIQLLVRERYGEKYSGGKSEKLIASLLDKEDLVMHHSTAELYARLGVRITVKKVLGFIESSVMNAWVEKATAGRIKAALEGDVLMVSLYKLIINAVVCTYILIYIHTYICIIFVSVW